MKNSFFAFLLLSLFTISLNATNPVDEITLTVNSAGEIIAVAPNNWTTGSLNSHYLDFAHTQKTFNDIELNPGQYSYKVQTKERNSKKGKMNFTLTVKYKNSSNHAAASIKCNSTGTKTGSFVIEDFHSRSNQPNAGYGKVKVHVGRAGANTNLNYKITLTRTGGSSCDYTSLGSKNGTVVGNTKGTFKSSKKACKNNATVKVKKTGGKARTTVLVYAANTKNGAGTLKDSYEFPNGNSKSTKTFNISGVNGKFIRVELKNRSATNRFKYTVTATQ